MKRETDLTKSGESLVEHAKERLRTTYGTVGELFPYIYEAAGRMSTRAIAEFLESEERISLSPSTVLRAVRKADEYFADYLDEVEAALETLKEPYGQEEALTLLTDEAFFRAEDANHPAVDEPDPQSMAQAYTAIDQAFETLRHAWWVGGPRYRREALRRLRERLAEAEEKPAPAKRRK